MGHYIYILRSLKHRKRIYTGITSNPRQRLAEHNRGKSSHTSEYRPWEMIACIWLADSKKAATFERYLKSGSGRAFIRRHFV